MAVFVEIVGQRAQDIPAQQVNESAALGGPDRHSSHSKLLGGACDKPTGTLADLPDRNGRDAVFFHFLLGLGEHLHGFVRRLDLNRQFRRWRHFLHIA